MYYMLVYEIETRKARQVSTWSALTDCVDQEDCIWQLFCIPEYAGNNLAKLRSQGWLQLIDKSPLPVQGQINL